MPRRLKKLFRLRLLTAILGVFAAAPAPAEPLPIVDVYTMGAGEELFTRFGHAAICVTDALSPAGRCYNYGTADFSTPGPLTVGIVRGNARFWVSLIAQPRMLAWYQRQDRTVYRQRLPYDPEMTPWLVETLHKADVRSATFYHYHHFNDNCTTRIRDLLDNAAHHTLGPATRAISDPPLRHFVDAGLAGRPLLIAVSRLFLGRAIDRPSTRWQSMFLPAILRAEVQSRFAAEPEVLYTRVAPLPAADPTGRDGTLLLAGIGALLGALILLGARLGRLRIGLIPTAIGLGGVGLFLTVLAFCSPLAELRYNEVFLLCWPTDSALALLSRTTLHRYARVRLLALLGCAILSLAGVLIQPLWGPLLLCGLPLVATFVASRPASP